MTAVATHERRFPSPDAPVVGALDLVPGEHGVRPRRLPGWTRRQISDPVFDFVVGMTSGVRVAVRTSADVVELELAVIGIDTGAPAVAALVDLVVDGSHRATGVIPGDAQTLVDGTGRRTQARGTTTVRFDGLGSAPKSLELWLPHTTATELVAIRADAPIAAARETRPIWLHHGSSISQGGEAASPTRTWPAIAAADAGVSLRSLGFSGNAVGDPFVARTMRDHPADRISIEIGINVVNADLMRRRMFESVLHGVIDTLRDGHPETPLLVIGPIPCPSLELMPGPTVIDPTTGMAASAGDPRELERGGMSLTTVRAAIASVLAARDDDPALGFLDGRSLLPPDEVADLDDGLHPNAAASERMGHRFAALAFADGGALAPR